MNIIPRYLLDRTFAKITECLATPTSMDLDCMNCEIGKLHRAYAKEKNPAIGLEELQTLWDGVRKIGYQLEALHIRSDYFEGFKDLVFPI